MTPADIDRAARIAADRAKVNYGYCRKQTVPCGTDCDCFTDAKNALNALIAAGYQIIPPVTGKVS